MEEEFELSSNGKTMIPVVYVTRDKDTGFCKFWCKYCSTWHRHGRGDGHRSAHCFIQSKSAYHNTGYILKTKLTTLFQNEEYTLNFFHINSQLRRSIKISTNNPDINVELANEFIKAYEDKNYLGATYFAVKMGKWIFPSLDEKNFGIIDLQSEGDGTPDFMVHANEDRKKDFYIEFKSHVDSLRLNQLYSFTKLTEYFEVYILHIEKKRNK